MGRVLLASMPASLPNYPNMALGLLKPAVQAAGFDCDVRYFSLDHLAEIGDAAHALMTDGRYHKAQIPDWVFAAEANDRPEEWGLDHITTGFARDFPDHWNAARLLTFLDLRAGAKAFIDRCHAAYDWSGYAVVGFTSSFQQNMASLALARRIKASHPGVFLIMGGANCQDEMGSELHRRYPFLDAVCQGEGDRAFPTLLTRIAKGGALEGIPGMVVRQGARTIIPETSTDSITDLDSLPLPDFDDFFDQHTGHGLTTRHPTAVVFETSRGCWWGARSHCTFCGLNGVTLTYRAKSPERALAELTHLVQRHGTREVANADNILAMHYFDSFIPRLAEAKLDLLIYYESKSNLKPWHWAALGAAGIRKVQAGIEALDTALLQLMRKGATALQNIPALKLAAEAGVYVEWLFLHGFPGEAPESYARTAALMPLLVHLQPPAAFLRVRADRFSPYQRDPALFGITLEPLEVYDLLYPFGADSINRLAYHFTMRSAALDTQMPTYAAAVGAGTQAWRDHHAESGLWLDPSQSVVHEARPGFTPGATDLSAAEAALIRLAGHPISWRAARETLPDHSEAALEAAAGTLTARGWLLREGAMLLALPLRQPGFRRAPSWAEISEGRTAPFSDTGAMAQPQPLVPA